MNEKNMKKMAEAVINEKLDRISKETGNEDVEKEALKYFSFVNQNVEMQKFIHEIVAATAAVAFNNEFDINLLLLTLGKHIQHIAETAEINVKVEKIETEE